MGPMTRKMRAFIVEAGLAGPDTARFFKHDMKMSRKGADLDYVGVCSMNTGRKPE